MTRQCPHCGNRDPRFIQSNGEPDASPALSLLCVARVAPDEWSFDTRPHAADYDDAGKVPCGMQWDPNEDKGHACNHPAHRRGTHGRLQSNQTVCMQCGDVVLKRKP